MVGVSERLYLASLNARDLRSRVEQPDSLKPHNGPRQPSRRIR
jgi:hypothetical protein